MRVTFTIAAADLAGGCKVVALYTRELIARGHEAMVIAPAPRKPSWKWRIRSALLGDVTRLFPPKHQSHLELLGVPHKYLDTSRAIQASDVPDADVIVATWWETVEWLAPFPRRKGARAYFIQGNETDLGNDRQRVIETWKQPFHKITVSSWLVDLVRQKVPDAEIALVPNTIDAAQFDAPPRRRNPVPTLGVSYSSIDIKGFDVATKAIERIRQVLPQLKVVSFSSERPSVHRPLPPNTDFTFRPAQERIRDIYAACDVWLSASRAEGFGLPALEAMACRCPLVSTRYGGPADFVRDDVNGYLVEVDDDKALAERALSVLQASDDKWQQLSAGAYQTAHGYTWTDATVKLEQALQRAIEKDTRA